MGVYGYCCESSAVVVIVTPTVPVPVPGTFIYIRLPTLFNNICSFVRCQPNPTQLVDIVIVVDEPTPTSIVAVIALVVTIALAAIGFGVVWWRRRQRSSSNAAQGYALPGANGPSGIPLPLLLFVPPPPPKVSVSIFYLPTTLFMTTPEIVQLIGFVPLNENRTINTI
jgi:hypothetical protein